jgi:hypothetical protein
MDREVLEQTTINIGKFGLPGTAVGQVLEPTDLAFDSQNNLIFVSDKDNRIDIFDSDGGYIRSWGTEGSGKGQFKKTADISADFQNHLLFVSDLSPMNRGQNLWFPVDPDTNANTFCGRNREYPQRLVVASKIYMPCQIEML